jgi:zinc protease
MTLMLLGGLLLMEPQTRFFPYDYQKVELKNGFKAYLIRAGAPGTFTFVTMVRTGSRDEVEPGRSGFAHFFEHMMFRGTEKYPAFDDVVSAMGAASNAFTSNDMTIYHITAASEHLQQVFDLESDRFRNLRYSEEAFRTEAGAVLGEQQQSKFDPMEFLEEQIRLTAFTTHPYRHTTIGFEEDVRAMPSGYEYSLSFYQRHYRPENCVLVLVGDFDPEEARQLVERSYSPWQQGHQAPQIPREPEQGEARELLVRYPNDTLPYLVFSYKGPAWSAQSKPSLAAMLLGELAFGSNSAIYRKLVLEEKRLQDLENGFHPERDPGLLQVWATASQLSDLPLLRAEILAEVERFRTTPVSLNQLQEVRSRIKYASLMQLETSRSTAFFLIPFVINSGGIEAMERFYATLDQLTPEDIQAAARQFLTPERRTLATMIAEGEELPERGSGLIERKDADSPFVAFNLWVRAGSQDDPQGKEGLAFLVGSLLDEGSTTALSYQEITNRLFPMAARLNVKIDKEMTHFSGTVHRDHLQDFADLFLDRVLDPGFKAEDLARIHAQQINAVERLRRHSRDEELTRELLMARAFAGTPYQHPVEGLVRSVKAIELADVKDFYQRHYTADAMVLGLAGSYPGEFAALLRGRIDRLAKGNGLRPEAPKPVPPKGMKLLLVDKKTNAAPLSLGFPIAVRRGDEDFFPLLVFNSWFGEHRNSYSHLYQVIREARGMNYGDYSYIEAFPLSYTTQKPPVNVGRRAQLFEIWLRPVSEKQPGTLHEQTSFALRAALRELKGVCQHGMAREDVERTKAFLHNFVLGYGETQQRRLDYAMDDAFYGLNPGFLERLRMEIAAVTPERVNAAIARHLQADDLHVVIVTQGAAELKDLLLSGRPTPLRYAGEAPAHLADEDREIAAFPLKLREEDITILPIDQVFESEIR